MKIRFVILFIAALTLNLYADAVTSGGTISVNSDSSLNALRNPAIMARQQTENTAFAYRYSYMMDSEGDINVSLAGVKAESDFAMSEDYNGALLFSNVFHSGRSSYGIGISNASDGQVVFSSIETSLKAGTYDVKTTDEKKYAGATLMLSYSYRLYNGRSFGLQIETAGSSESVEKHKEGTDESTLNSDVNKITSGCTFGYYLYQYNYEAGVMLKSGRYGIENQNYELETSSDESIKKISNYYMNDEGPGVLLGFGIKPFRKLKVFFEAGYSIPYSYEEKSCDDDTLEKSTDDVDLVYTYGGRWGITYAYSRFLNFGMGGSYIRFKTESSSNVESKTATEKFSVSQINAGIDIKPSKEYTLLFGAGYKRVLADLFEEKATSDFGINVTEDYLELMAGVSCNY